MVGSVLKLTKIALECGDRGSKTSKALATSNPVNSFSKFSVPMNSCGHAAAAFPVALVRPAPVALALRDDDRKDTRRGDVGSKCRLPSSLHTGDWHATILPSPLCPKFPLLSLPRLSCVLHLPPALRPSSQGRIGGMTFLFKTASQEMCWKNACRFTSPVPPFPPNLLKGWRIKSASTKVASEGEKEGGIIRGANLTRRTSFFRSRVYLCRETEASGRTKGEREMVEIS